LPRAQNAEGERVLASLAVTDFIELVSEEPLDSLGLGPI
jgi:hypothetical protein